MEQFDIIGAFETYALAQGWKFVYGYDDFYSNIGVQQEFANGELVLIADFRAITRINAGRINEITYTCLLMLGRKFDDNGEAASLDETAKQKYDRRLKDLAQMLANMIANVSCDNELDVTAAPIGVDINVFDTNIDFAISENATFVQ